MLTTIFADGASSTGGGAEIASALKTGVEAVEHGYTTFEFPMVDLYLPIETGRELRMGAFEEGGVRLERDTDDSWTKEGLADGGVEKPPELDAKGKPVKVEPPVEKEVRM